MITLIDSKSLNEQSRPDISPGQEISARMKKYGWDQIDLAFVLDVSESTASNIVRGRTQINYQLAVALSQIFGETAEYWIMRQVRYSQWMERKSHKPEDIQRMAMLFKLFPVREMMQMKWISADSASRDIERAMITLLGEQLYLHLRNLGEQREPSGANFYLFRSEMAELLWVRKAMEMVPDGDIPYFDLDRIQSIAEKLHNEYSGFAGHLKLLNDLESAGVVFRILPGFQKLSLSGGLFWKNKSPVLIYTQRYDTFPPFQNFIEIMLRVCSRFAIEVSDDISKDAIAQGEKPGMSIYPSPNGSFRIIDLDYVVGFGMNKPVDLSKIEALSLIPGRDIPVFYHHHQSLLRKVSPTPKAEPARLDFPPKYYLQVTRSKKMQGGNRNIK